MSRLTDNEKANAVRDYARQCNGSENLTRHMGGLLITDGMRFLAETCGAWWLLDLVASHRRAYAGESFTVWRITGDGKRSGVVVEAWTDTPGEGDSVRLVSQRVPYSDFPRELMPFEWWVENGTAMLKEER